MSDAASTITVLGYGRTSRIPDAADVQLGIRLVRPTATAARSDGAQLMERILEAVGRLGVRRADVATSSLSLGPNYEYGDGPPRITSYQLANQVSISVHRVEEVAAIVDAAIGAGATALDGVIFRVSDPASAEREALAAAFDDARARGEVLARAAGLAITGVASVTETAPGGGGPVPLAMRMEGAGDTGTPVLAGVTHLEARVSVVFTAASGTD